MAGSLGKTLKRWEVAFRTSWGTDVSRPGRRAVAVLHYHLVDQAWLRLLWRNEARVAPGLWRSNQPGRFRLEELRQRGFRTLLNLRGERRESHFLLEERDAAELGFDLVNIDLHARAANRREALLALFDAFREAERPILMHCKSGADRTGLAAALYLIAFEGRSVAEARRDIGVGYLHLSFTKTGICDHVLDLYEVRLKDGPIGLEDWIRTEYDAEALTRSFAAQRRRA